MKNYIDLLLITIVVVYIVDLSGFTQAWRSALARFLKAKELKPLKPFDCSQCMVWWVCLIYTIATTSLTIYLLAYIAILAFLSITVGQVLIFIRELLIFLINKITNTLNI